MCVGVPGKVVLIEKGRAKIEIPASAAGEAHSHWVDISTLEEKVREGDYLVSYQDVAINRISAQEAEEVIALMNSASDAGIECAD